MGFMLNSVCHCPEVNLLPTGFVVCRVYLNVG